MEEPTVRIVPGQGEVVELPGPARVQLRGLHEATLVWYNNPYIRPKVAHLLAGETTQSQSRAGYEVGVENMVPVCKVSWFVHDLSGSMSGVLTVDAVTRESFTLKILRADSVYPRDPV